jgi:hypothetical protein
MRVWNVVQYKTLKMDIKVLLTQKIKLLIKKKSQDKRKSNAISIN